MASNVSAGLSSTLMKQYWNEKFLDEFRSNLVFRDLGLEGKVPDNAGQVVHWLALADLSVNTTPATENVDPTSYTLSGGDMNATLTPYNDSIQLSRQLAQVWISGGMDDVINRLARLAAAKIDRVIRDTILTAGGVAKYGGTATARNLLPQDPYYALTVAQARKARGVLEGLNVQPHTDGFYVCVSHPDTLYDIEGDTNWRDIVKYNPSTFTSILKGEIGEINKIRFISTTEAFVSAMGSGATPATVYQNYVMGTNAFGVSELQDVDIIVKDPAPASSVNGYSTVGYYVSFAAKALRTSALVRLETISTLNS